jgi:uncharacterized protein (TIGR02118 family)
MIRVTVLYPDKTDGRFDDVYYCEKHIPMVKRLLGPALKGVVVDFGLSGEAQGSRPPYFAMVHLSFESLAAFEASFAPHDAAITQDIPNYTNVDPIVQISEVRIDA